VRLIAIPLPPEREFEAAAVAILPPALLVERFSLGAWWAFPIPEVLLPDYRPLFPPFRWEFGPQELVAVT
jgi:hypothetical protein